jgi:hypothetical protein
MIQILADHVDQMDLALDQLALKDRNFDRFAMVLIDNVVELTLHQYAKDKARENDMWGRHTTPSNDPKLVTEALGQYFEAKVKLAKSSGLMTPEVADSFMYLHAYRNTVYHAGVQHEAILHSLALFYFRNACVTLSNYSPDHWTYSSRDRISHRAMKYLGKPRGKDGTKTFKAAWERLHEIADTMGDTLIADLHADMSATIETVDELIKYLVDGSLTTTTRKEVVIDCQVWPLAFTDEAKAFAAKKGYRGGTVADYVDWLASNYPLPFKVDPIPSWRRRLTSLTNEKNKHVALKKYCEFMKQSEGLRQNLETSAGQLDAHVENQMEAARGN